MPGLCSNLVRQKTYQLQIIADCYFGLSMVYRLILVAIYNFKFEENKIIRDDSGLMLAALKLTKTSLCLFNT